jgi:hypothetical protein
LATTSEQGQRTTDKVFQSTNWIGFDGFLL